MFQLVLARFIPVHEALLFTFCALCLVRGIRFKFLEQGR